MLNIILELCVYCMKLCYIFLDLINIIMEVNVKLQTRHLSAADDKIQFKSTKKVVQELNAAVAY